MTNSQVREHFQNKNLTYEDITEGDILTLIILLNKAIKQACKECKMSVNTMRLSQKINSKYSTNGRLLECYIYINSHYFTRRECISFHKNGFIGFAGWASSRNTAPILEAFIKWCDILAEQKEDNNGLGGNYERILYRGKSEGLNEWIYGYLYKASDEEYLIQNKDDLKDSFYVIPETVGQYIGKKDKNGTMIFEGDIYHMGDKNIKYVVVWHDTGLKGKQIGSSSYAGLEYWKNEIEVIGNITDNTDLLNGGNE